MTDGLIAILGVEVVGRISPMASVSSTKPTNCLSGSGWQKAENGMMMKDEIANTISLGRENQEMIALGKAWCTHIRTDREGGIGLVEQMTELPITGGGFTCDYAQRPADPFGMKLAETAVEFYENNCRGCKNRAPGGRIPNLGTWAEEEMAERARREAKKGPFAKVWDLGWGGVVGVVVRLVGVLGLRSCRGW